MTLRKLNALCRKHNIPEDVKLLSDSGWECCETEMDGIWYCKDINTIVFTQDICDYEKGYEPHGYGSKLPHSAIFEKLT